MPADPPVPHLSRRALLGAGAALCAPSAYAQATPVKIVSVLVRKAGVSHEAFVRQWLAGRAGPGVKGLVASEIMATPNGATGVDGIASAWCDDRAAPLPWDDFADGSKSKAYVAREHVFAPIVRKEGAIKRISLVVRNPNLTHAAFIQHWLEVHGPGARGIPGLTGFVLTELEPSSTPDRIDGISESWWEGGPADQGGMVASPEHARWSADGNTLIDRARSAAFITREHVLVPLKI